MDKAEEHADAFAGEAQETIDLVLKLIADRHGPLDTEEGFASLMPVIAHCAAIGIASCTASPALAFSGVQLFANNIVARLQVELRKRHN